MFLLKTPEANELTGKAAELFAMFPEQIGAPLPLRVLSASPGLLELKAREIEYSRNHKALGFPVLAAIRFIGARHWNAPACIDFNRRLLMAAGLDAEQVDALPEAGDAYTEPEAALLRFIAQTIAAPEGVTPAKLDTLRGLGWADDVILDALAHAANMQVAGFLVKALTRP